MNLFLDNIIFALQKSGGISVLWYELLQRILNDPELNPLFLEAPNNNFFRANLTINEDKVINNPYSNYPISIQRFLNPNHLKVKGIFHSSYYRIVNNPNVVKITTLHDFTYEHFRKGIAKVIHHYQKEIAILNSKRIICVSQSTKEDLLKFYPKIDTNHIRVIYNGVNNIYQHLSDKNEVSLKKLIDFSSKEFALFVGGRKNEYKNFKTAVKACHIANVPLVLVGGGSLSHGENSYLIENLGLNRYKLLQEIKNDQLNLIYNHSLCLLYPSISEGFGIPIIEAQRAGCPVISTNYSSIPEVAGEGAILLNEVTVHQIADMLNLIKNDSTIVANLRKEGFKNSERFSWDKCYQQTKLVYQEVHEEYLS